MTTATQQQQQQQQQQQDKYTHTQNCLIKSADNTNDSILFYERIFETRAVPYGNI